MRISDQSAAIKLAICDDIGERSYDFADVAAILVQMLTRLPSVGKHRVCSSNNLHLCSCGFLQNACPIRILIRLPAWNGLT